MKGKSVADILNFTYTGGNFSCYDRKLTSLEGAPASVEKDFYCDNNQLTSLEGAPSSVGGDFDCENNRLTSLKDIHKQIKQINGAFYAPRNPIRSHVLGLLLIKGLKRISVDNEQVTEILNNHLPSSGMRDVLEAQEELMNAGLDEFAQL